MGREVDVPKGYNGVVVVVKQAKMEPGVQDGKRMTKPAAGDGEQSLKNDEPKTVEQVGQFDKLVVWQHEAVVDGDDVFVKGVDEMFKLAESVRNQRYTQEMLNGRC